MREEKDMYDNMCGAMSVIKDSRLVNKILPNDKDPPPPPSIPPFQPSQKRVI
jgi:hypothetical protein